MGASHAVSLALPITLLLALPACKGEIVTATGGSSGTTITTEGGGGAGTTSSSQGGSGGQTTSTSMSGSGGSQGGGGTGGSTGPLPCVTDADCAGLEETPFCDAATGACVECVEDTQCAPGHVCAGSHACVEGCSQDQPCSVGLSCCFGACFDLESDPANCGACGFVCDGHPNMNPPVCSSWQCQNPGCSGGFADCDLQIWNGCERNLLADGPCTCTPGETQSCYLGLPGTEGVGPCHGGLRTCDASGAGWGECLGQVLPAGEACANGVDDDCDGQVDEDIDLDGDGWGVCDGDCNDLNGEVNPGAYEDTWGWNDAFEFVEGAGNGVDDDCNPATPDFGIATCASAPLSSGVTALDLAAAMELCQIADPNAPKAQKTWGLLSASFVAPDGSALSPARLAEIQGSQAAVLSSYGASTPRRGATMVGLSTGKMRAPGQAEYVAPSPGTDFGATGQLPAAYLAAHNGQIPAIPDCNGPCPGGAGANDGVALRLSVRVPSNGEAFSFRMRFFTAEYPNNLCSTKNDFALGMLATQALGMPQDKNVVFDAMGSPVSVNNARFDACAPVGCQVCAAGAADLLGTGMPAATGWLGEDAPAVPGETMTLDLMVFDVADGAGDSVLLLDSFRWVESYVIIDH